MSGSSGDDGLSTVATSTLRRLRGALHDGLLPATVTRPDLAHFGLRESLDRAAAALAGHTRHACLAVVEAVLAERTANERSTPELVWTGPDGRSATARDTSVVLRELFEQARRRVVLAGYSFDHADRVLSPLHRNMCEHDIDVMFFVDIRQDDRRPDEDMETFGRRELETFIERNWPFGAPYPHVFCDRRALHPGPPWTSLHAKCVVVDGRRAFVSSANFTSRGQERNIEVGVLLDDVAFAERLERQWHSLVDADKVFRRKAGSA